jgi:hypothetical protein
MVKIITKHDENDKNNSLHLGYQEWGNPCFFRFGAFWMPQLFYFDISLEFTDET